MKASYTSVHKQQLPYSDNDKYLKFMIENLAAVDPSFYSVCQHRQIETADGSMVGLVFDNNITDPDKELITLFWVNHNHLWYWKKQIWLTGVDDRKKSGNKAIYSISKSSNFIIIYPIGECEL